MAAFLFLCPYYQNTKAGRIYCQVLDGILTWKLFCINACYFRLARRALTDFPQKALFAIQKEEAAEAASKEVHITEKSTGLGGGLRARSRACS